MTELLSGKAELARTLARWRAEGARVGLVPTMGALHEGHLSLVRAARERCDRVIASIFVNPLQFAPNEDLERYPRDLDGDRARLASAGCHAVFTTSPPEMYPDGYSTYVVNDQAALRLEGSSRPTHFRGVLTVVAKLFNLVRPDLAVFGQKDAQQALLIRRMVRDLEFPVEVLVQPIVREADGLAMSSRNAYLSAEERVSARSLSAGLAAARRRFEQGEREAKALLEAASEPMRRDGGVAIDYVALVDQDRFTDVETVQGGALLLVAARVGKTRLIDNALLEEGSGGSGAAP